MMPEPQSFAQAVEDIPHYRALRMERIWLQKDCPDIPWDKATGVREGGSHRLDMTTTLWFSYQMEPDILFEWSFDLEPDATYDGSYHIDVDSLRWIMSKLPNETAHVLAGILEQDAHKVRARGEEYQTIANKQIAVATTLHSIAGAVGRRAE